jgi:hypothetical protein
MKSRGADTNSREQISIPYSNDSTRITNRRGENKLIKPSGTEIVNICAIKSFPLSFLEANHIATRFINFLPDIIPSRLRINSPEIPI